MSCSDKWNWRIAEVSEHRWALFMPGLCDPLMTMSDDELIDREPLNLADVIKAARPGDWVPLRDGIAIRLGSILAGGR